MCKMRRMDVNCMLIGNPVLLVRIAMVFLIDWYNRLVTHSTNIYRFRVFNVCVLGKSYFFSGELYWQFNDARMRVQRGYPRPIGERWFGCPRRQASSGRDHVTSRSSLQPRLSAIAITLLFTVLNIA